jgi:hypothetical protein
MPLVLAPILAGVARDPSFPQTSCLCMWVASTNPRNLRNNYKYPLRPRTLDLNTTSPPRHVSTLHSFLSFSHYPRESCSCVKVGPIDKSSNAGRKERKNR